MDTTTNSKAKANCFEDFKKGSSVDHLFEKYEISRSTLYRWIKGCETPDKPVILRPQDKKNLTAFH